MGVSTWIERHLPRTAPVFAALLLAAPVVAHEAASANSVEVGIIADGLVAAGTSPSVALEHATQLTDADRRLLLAHPRMLTHASGTTTLPGAPFDPRGVVETRLTAADVPPADAQMQTLALTPADVEVLLAHPAMLQRAGSLSHMDEAVLIGVLIVAAIVALAASGSGFVSIR